MNEDIIFLLGGIGIAALFIVLSFLKESAKDRDRARAASDKEMEVLDRLVTQLDRMERRLDNLETIVERPGREGALKE